MFYPSISSFIPLLLHLGVSASTANLPQSPDTHFTDLSPRITANSTLFINSSLNPDQVTNVYKSDGKLLYRAIPSSLSSEKFLVIENVLDPLSLKLVKLVSRKSDLKDLMLDETFLLLLLLIESWIFQLLFWSEWIELHSCTWHALLSRPAQEGMDFNQCDPSTWSLRSDLQTWSKGWSVWRNSSVKH